MLKDEKQTLWKLSAFLIGAALPLHLFGPAVLAVFLGFGVIIGAFATKDDSLRSTVKTIYKSNTIKLVGALLIAFLLSALFAIDMQFSLIKFYSLVGVAFFSLILYLVLREMPSRHVHGAMNVFCGTTIFVITLCLLDAFLNDARLSSALHGRKWDNISRLNYMSSNLAVIVPFLWAWLLQNYREWAVLARWFALPLAIVSFLTIFICGGRSGWIAILISSAIFLIIAGKRHNLILHTKHWFLGLGVVALAPIMYGFVRGFSNLQERVGSLLNGEDNSGRLEIWKYAIDRIGENNIITGVGLNGFRKLPLPEGETSMAFSNFHPHNFILQLILESGILGFAIAAIMIVLIIKYFAKLSQGNIYGLAGLCSIIAFFTASLTNTSIFSIEWLTFLIVSALFSSRIGWTSK